MPRLWDLGPSSHTWQTLFWCSKQVAGVMSHRWAPWQIAFLLCASGYSSVKWV